MPRFAIDACRAHVTMKAPDAGAALAWGVRNLRVPAEHITVRPLPDANPPNLGHNTPMIMSKKKTTKKAAKPADDIGTRVAKAARIIKANEKAKKKTLGDRVVKAATPKAKPAADPKEGMSGLDAAALVLKGHGPSKSLTAKEIVEEIQRRELAPTLKGKTPHATIYAAMITEIAKKGEEARFERGAEKGKFTYHEPKPAKA